MSDPTRLAPEPWSVRGDYILDANGEKVAEVIVGEQEGWVHQRIVRCVNGDASTRKQVRDMQDLVDAEALRVGRARADRLSLGCAWCGVTGGDMVVVENGPLVCHPCAQSRGLAWGTT